MTSFVSSGKWTLAENFREELRMDGSEIAGGGTLFDSKFTSEQTAEYVTYLHSCA